MIALIDLLAAFLPVSIAGMLLVLASLSYRLGAVTRQPPHYHWFYLAFVLASSSAVIRILAVGEEKSGVPLQEMPVDRLLPYGIPLVLALGVGVRTAWHYWAWLVYAREI